MTNPSSPAERIHLSAPHMSERERNAMLAAFDSNWIAPVGPAVDEFEARVRSIAQTEAALAVTSGTAALHLSMLALGIGPGDIVLIPSVTFVASANVVTYVGAIPHFVDCEPISGNIDPESLVETLVSLDAAGHRPAALMTIDLYGVCANYTTITAVCERYGVPIIEDAAEAIGASHQGRPAGSFGALAAYSFNGNKLVTTGGGGALVGPADLIEKAAHLANQARLPVRHFEHDQVGYAYRLSNLSAAIGTAQLERLDSMMGRTRAIHRRYAQELGTIEGVSFASQTSGGSGNGWLSVAHLDQSLHPSPSTICERLGEHNIEARPTWKPMHLQPVYASAGMTGGDGAESHYATGLCLPSGSSMNATDQTRVIAAVKSALDLSESVVDSLDTTLDIDQIDVDQIDVTDERSQQHQDNRATTR